MKAKLYTLEIYDSILAHSHGFKSVIKELYIPKLKTSINIHNDKVHVFKTTDKNRYTCKQTNAVCLGEINLPDDIVKLIDNYKKIKNKVHMMIPAFFETNDMKDLLNKQKQ